MRVPLRWNVNPRIILLDPELNPERFTFELYFRDPQVLMIVQSRFQEYIATTPASKKRGIHLCGDVSRHLPLIHEKLGVISFDTGFPINHGALRKALGPEVEVSGGPSVSLLQFGTPEQCYARSRDILQSGIKEGGRFILQEGNNLPPACPLDNLRAVYAACLEFGRYE